jgi:hypothetical protein
MKILPLIILSFIPTLAFAQFSQDYQEGKVKFRVQYSFGTSNTLWQRQFQNQTIEGYEDSRQAELIVASNPDHTQRMNALGAFCKGKSFDQVMQMAQTLGGKFNEGYDYSRMNGGNSDVVASKDVWDAYRNRLTWSSEKTQAGVCRDIASALSEFLISCGIPKNQIAIEGFNTGNTGHQIVTVQDGKGNIYNINYSEVYKQKYDPWFNGGVDTSFYNTGIRHTRYDAETGKVTDIRLTEMGHILMAVTGGHVDSPDYIPELLQVEANYGVLTAGAYLSSTMRGDVIKGVKLAYEQRPLKWLHISSGFTYANATLDNPNMSENGQYGLPWKGEQDMLFFQVSGGVDIPDLQFLKSADKQLYLDTNINSTYAGAVTKSTTNGRSEEWNYDHLNVTKMEANIVYDSKRVNARIGGGGEMSVNDRPYNTQRPGNDNSLPMPFMRGEYVQGEMTLKGNKLSVKAGGRMYFYSYGATNKYYLSFLFPKADAVATISVIQQKDVAGNSYNYLQGNIQKRIDLRQAGDLNVNVSAMGTLNSATPDWRVQTGLSYSMKPKAPYKSRKDVNR